MSCPTRRHPARNSGAIHQRQTKGHSMAFARSTIRTGKLALATVFALGMLTTVSQAYTPEQEQMCTGDAMRLCGSEIPDVERVTACMIRLRAQLSDGCKAVFQYQPPAPAATTPASYAPSSKPSKPMNLVPHKRG